MTTKYYTTLDLMVYHAKRGTQCLGTVRRNTIPDCKLPSKKDLKQRNAEHLMNI
jgi:hypothetical protein